MARKTARVFFVLSSVFACAPTRPLADAQPSVQALARAILEAVDRRDEAALRRLAVTEDEFRHHIWPELPAARPERNLPLSYVWGDLHQKSEAGLRTILAEHGGQRYELVDVRLDGNTDYAAYRLHRHSVFAVRKGSNAPTALRLCGSLLEKDGRWKVFSFVVDD